MENGTQKQNLTFKQHVEIKSGKRIEDGLWVFGRLEAMNAPGDKENVRVIRDNLGRNHLVYTASVSDRVETVDAPVRDGHFRDLYEGHIISCIIDGQTVVRTIESDTLLENGIHYTWTPLNECTSRIGEYGQLLDVKIIGHIVDDPELLSINK